MDKHKLLVLQGLPASGKSTWAKEYCAQHGNWVRINRDDLRHMRGKYWMPKQEKLISDWEFQCTCAAFARGVHVVIDATNLSDKRNKAREAKLKEAFPNLEVSYKFFQIELDEAIRRDLQRPFSVGERTIRRMYEDHLAPPPVVYEEDDGLPHCVIFDVDGTLAKMEGRHAFDWARVEEDKVNAPVANLARLLHASGKEIIIFTGRDGSCLPQTEAWLRAHQIPFQQIFIRPAGNSQPDYLIKRELFEAHIRGKFYVELVIDDRDQVVRMWRQDLGLVCLQADYGDF